MSLYADKSVEVERLDNGWVLTWEDKDQALLESYKSNTLGGVPLNKKRGRGREILTDRKKLMKRIEQLI